MCIDVLIFLSIVLESFPISSSGHILLLKNLFSQHGISCLFTQHLEYFLHAPTACITAFFFYRRWRAWLAFPYSIKLIGKIFILGFVTDVVTVILYFLGIQSLHIPLWFGFLMTGFALCSLYFCKENNMYTSWNIRNACILGFVQGCALIPGISRFGSTFVAARWLGFSGKKAFELSFLIEFPISVVAALKGACDLYSTGQLSECLHLKMVLIMIIASSGALVGLWIMNRMIRADTTWIISFYLFFLSLFTAVM